MQVLVSALEMREMDRRTIEELAVPGRVLMEVAGRGVAEVCARRLLRPSRVAVACGTGNNGGDGFVVARALMALGHEVRVFIFGDRQRIKGDARSALDGLERLAGDVVTGVEDPKELSAFASYLAGAELAVDALLGTGLSNEVRGLMGGAVDVLNEQPCAKIAVDIPSGVDSDTGAILGRAVQAVETVTFAFAKRGHYLHPGAELCGRVTVVDIGIPRRLAAELGVAGRLLSPEDIPELLPSRPASAHKGTFGHAVVLAGAPGTPGAAVLALEAALRAGAGLVSWAAAQSTVSNAPPRPSEVMLRVREKGEPVDAWAERLLRKATALAAGPGLSTTPERAEELASVLAHCDVPICMDADGLNLMAADSSLWERVRAPLVVTPHPMEMARLAGTSVAEVQRDRFASALQLAMARRCVVVLKGAGTVVADPDGGVAIVGAGNPGMATGGTGDVLTGIIGGLLAQGLEPSRAARAGALVHAVAGDLAAEQHGQAGLRALDIVGAMGAVFARHGR